MLADALLDTPVVLVNARAVFVIKAAVDRDRQLGRFLLAGSADVLVLPGIAGSLAGRMEVLSLWPLSCAEMADSAVFNRADALFAGNARRYVTELCRAVPYSRLGVKYAQAVFRFA